MKKGPSPARVRTHCTWDRFLVIAMGGLALGSPHAVALDPALPGQSFDSSRYQGIWTKSPFAVASPDQAQTSAQYQLVGIARIDDVSYASLIDSQNGGKHFLLFSHQPRHGLQLISVELAHGTSPALAILQKDGQELRLEMAAPANGMVNAASALTQNSSPNATTPPVLVNAPGMTPPEGGSLPLVFQNVDPASVHLTADQIASINKLRQDFAKAIANPAPSSTGTGTSSTSTPTSGSSNQATTDSNTSPQLQTWETAQQQSDSQFEALWGYEAYNAYKTAVARASMGLH